VFGCFFVGDWCGFVEWVVYWCVVDFVGEGVEVVFVWYRFGCYGYCEVCVVVVGVVEDYYCVVIGGDVGDFDGVFDCFCIGVE